MKKSVILFAFLLCLGPWQQLSAQPSIRVGSDTYALVVGIAKYKEIDPLQYADRDAKAFYDYLRSPAGGNLDEDHVHLLLNEDVTTFNLIEELRWLKSKLQQGDRCFIYFSGHGDNDDATVDKYGFLLTYDTPRDVYMAGAFNIDYLQSYVRTFSAQGAKVILITDACHSGNLAGNSIHGTRSAGAALERQFGDEIKVLSCQPDEFSYEDEQWGGGRGVFSWYFVRGLMGLADYYGNQDGKVNVKELRRYLEDHVPEEVRPESQNPIVNGPIDFVLAEVDEEVLADLVKEEEMGMATAMTEITTKGFEETLLDKADTLTRLNYALFKESLEEERLTEPENDCAWYYYQLLVADTTIIGLHNLMTRNLAAKLQSESQNFLNTYLRGDTLNYTAEDAREIAGYLNLSAQLLGQDHILYPSIVSRENFFKGLYEEYSLAAGSEEEAMRRAIGYYRKSIALDERSPHTYNELGAIYMDREPIDSAIYFFKKAIQYAPQWTYPKFNLGLLYAERDERDSALLYYLSCLEIDSAYISALTGMGDVYKKMNQWDTAIYYYQKTIEIDTNYGKGYFKLGYAWDELDSVDLAVDYYIKAISKDYMINDALYNIAHIYYIHEDYERSRDIILIAMNNEFELDADLYNILALDYQYLGDTANQFRALSLALEVDSTHYFANRNMGLYYADKGNYDLAYHYLGMALETDNQNSDLYEKIAEVAKMEGDWDMVKSAYEAETRVFPEIDYVYDSLFVTYMNLDDTAMAVYQFRRKLKITDDRESAYTDWGYYAYLYSLDDVAFAVYDTVLQMNPDNIDALYYTALLYVYGKSDMAEAEPYIDRMLELDTGDRYESWSYDQMAYIKGANGHLEVADKLFAKAIEDEAERSTAYYNWACVYSLAGKSNKALDYLKRSLKAGFDNYELITTDPDFDNIRGTDGFNALIFKYFEK